MDQIQIDADSSKNPMTLVTADSQDPDSDSDTPPAGSDSSSSEDILIDQVSVSDCDAESSPENLFRAFTDNEMMTRVEGMERETVVKSFLTGMGKAGEETRVVAVHKNSSGLIRRARFEAFRIFTQAVARKCGGNPNIKYGCFGGSKEEIGEILAYGFSARNEAVRGRVHLVPMRFAVDAAAGCGVDEDGMRHLLICKVLLGKSELIPEDFRNGPDSIEFDSGVDRMLNPRKYIVWSGSMNTHICPAYVVSFKAPGGLEKYRARFNKVFSYNDLMAVLERFFVPEDMAELYKWRDDYKQKKISLADLHRKLAGVDRDVMELAMKLVEPMPGEYEEAFPATGVVNLPNLMEVLPRFLPASKMDVLAKLRDDYYKKKISLAELNRRVELVVDEKDRASAIKLMKSGLNRSAFMDALARLLPPSEMKRIAGLVQDCNSKKISRSEFERKVKLVVGDKVWASAIKMAKTNSQQRSNTASDVKLKGPNSQILFHELLPFLENSLSSQKMALLTKSHEDFRANKISRGQMVQRAALIVGNELFDSAVKSYRSQQQNV